MSEQRTSVRHIKYYQRDLNQLGLFVAVKKNIRGTSYTKCMEKSYIESFAKEGNLALWSQNEFYYLQSAYKNILMTIRAWLSYRMKDAAQKIIWKALRKMDSFLSVLYSKKILIIQITH